MNRQSPLVDITSLNGIESLFHASKIKDPWGAKSAGNFADFFIYSDSSRFTMPIRQKNIDIVDVPIPNILSILKSRDSDVLNPVAYYTEEKRMLRQKYLEDSFNRFADWARNCKGPFKQWLLLHRESWIKEGHLARVRPRFVFDVEQLKEKPLLKEISLKIDVDIEDILYGFDVILRYPLYGRLAGKNTYFLAHPIRELQSFPTMTVRKASPPNVALSLSKVVENFAPNQTLDEYTSFLHEARGIIRERGIHHLKPRSLDRDTIRELAVLLKLPARLNASGKILGIAAGVIGAIGAVPVLGPSAALIGGCISVASALWTGSIGRIPTKWSWLRWALKWDIESQAVND